MKKITAILLIVLMVLSLVACSTINNTEVSILWSGDGIVKVPNSLINATERAMYNAKINYKHYGANGNQSVQTEQAKAALSAGCSALIVELVDSSAAQEIANAASEKNVPIIFFNCEVSADVVASYEKCIHVGSDEDSVDSSLGELLASNLISEKKGLFDFITGKAPTYEITEEIDRNEDGAITYLPIGNVTATIAAIDAELKKVGLPSLIPAATNADAASIADFVTGTHTNKDNEEIALLNTAEGVSIELILVENDVVALDVLIALQEHGFNSNKLKTHALPIYTIGNDADYKAHVLKTMPAAPADFKTESKDEIKKLDNWWTTNEDVLKWKDANANICSLYSVEWADIDEFLYTTSDVIDSGRITGAAFEDHDTIAITVANILRNMLSGKSTFDGIELDNISGNVAKVPYTTKPLAE